MIRNKISKTEVDKLLHLKELKEQVKQRNTEIKEIKNYFAETYNEGELIDEQGRFIGSVDKTFNVVVK